MDAWLAEQYSKIAQIERTIENFKKVGQKNFTPAITRNRMIILKEYWARCQQLHTLIESTATSEQKEDHAYFQKSQFIQAEDAYLEASDYLTTILDKLTKPIVASSPNTSASDSYPDNLPFSFHLPRIDLPKFSGSYIEWANFRDLFESLVVNNERLSNVHGCII